ncbi:(2Fe-2S)-binding protein [Piscinibacter sp. XHJ-5]|uniref:(2Fe-2S)-binding protein n=1 Tax=Piscinibacter sp. XHJ-5 TaxID=3037797 RepID=UPI0024532478|nr:(2Fe-2S)-binding protein [Piscinibacter sp. XHJ-5]
MIVCVCRRVSDHQIRQAVADGAVSLECLQFDLGVATQCGRCADCASKVLCDARSGQAGASHAPEQARQAQMA